MGSLEKLNQLDPVTKILDALPLPEKYLTGSDNRWIDDRADWELRRSTLGSGSPDSGTLSPWRPTTRNWQPKIRGISNGPGTRSPTSVPTAHVMPNMTFDHNFASLPSPPRIVGGVPRSGSLDRLQRSHHQHVDTAMMTSHLPDKKWGSYGNVASHDPYGTVKMTEQFEHLTHDPEATFQDPSTDVYSHYRQQLHGIADKYDTRFLDTKTVPITDDVKHAISYQYHMPVPAEVTEGMADSLSYGYPSYQGQHQSSALSHSSYYSHGRSGRETELNTTAPSTSYSHAAAGLSTGTFSNDLTHWQQKHQEQLHRQHFEVSHVVSQPHHTYQSSVSTSHARVQSSYPTHTSSVGSSVMMHDPHKLDAVKQAADNIIREKDNIIERQKQKLIEYEDRVKVNNLESRQSLLKTALHQDNSMATIKLQKLQYENASLKAQLTEVVGQSANCDVAQLQRQLGKTEYEMSELKTQNDKELASKDTTIRELQQQLVGQDGACLEWKDKHMDLKKSYDALRRKLENYERYLEDLPTADEQSKHTQELKGLKEERAKYKHRVVELDKRLAEAKKGIRSRDGLIESLESAEAELREQLERSKEQSSKLSAELSRIKSGHQSEPEDDVDQLKSDNQRLKTELDRAKKLMETQHKRQQSATQKHQKEVARLEERLAQEEAAVTGLKEEAATKEQHLKKLRQSVKELGSQNQDLLEKNLVLGDRLKEFDKQQTGELHKLERRLLKEMNVCFTELQSLVEVCSQRAEGQNPDISMLLGGKSSTLEGDQAADHSVQSMRYKVDKVSELRKQIDSLREIISTKLAEEMGDNLNCTQQ